MRSCGIISEAGLERPEDTPREPAINNATADLSTRAVYLIASLFPPYDCQISIVHYPCPSQACKIPTPHYPLNVRPSHGEPSHDTVPGGYDATHRSMQYTAIKVSGTFRRKFSLRTPTNVSQDLQCVANCDSTDPDEIRRFSMPVIQTYLTSLPLTWPLLTVS